MNARHLHLLFNDNVMSVNAVFQPDGQSYTYLTNVPIKAGQPFVVSQSGNVDNMDMKVVYAVEDSGPLDIDWDAKYDYKFIVCAIDVEKWQIELDDFSKQILAGRKMEKQRARNTMRNEIMEAYKGCPELLTELLASQGLVLNAPKKQDNDNGEKTT